MQQINSSPVTAPMQTNTPAVNPLDLHDIHVPEQISNFPVAYGWWILAALVLLFMVMLLIKWRQRAKLKRHQQQAILQLQANPNMNNSDVIALLKWTAMQYFPRHQLAKIYGEQFQSFLNSKLLEKHQPQFHKLAGNCFIEQYKVNEHNNHDNSENLHQAALLWLKQALPPIKGNAKNAAELHTAEVKL